MNSPMHESRRVSPDPAARGRLITLEGGEGAGKSTHAQFVGEWLERQGRTVVRTREPGGSPVAEALRGIVLGQWAEGIGPTTELLLMFAARAAHLDALIRPALDQGQDVVCDRFIDASWAYQGAGRGIAPAHLAALENLVLGGLRPTLTLVFDLDPQVGLARARHRGDANRFEAETLPFMSRVRSAYLERAAQDPARYAVIDASRSIEDVRAALEPILGHRLQRQGA